ncbi:MAG: protein translocase subunit SecF [Actinomycetota bacterium]
MSRFASLGNRLYTGETSLDVVGKQRRWYAISGVILLVSVGALLTRGLTLGLEFTGGSEFRVTNTKTTSDVLGARAVTDVVAGAIPKVAKVGTNSVRVQTDKLSDTQTEQVRTNLATAYAVPVENVTASFIGPSWGRSVSTKALTGLLVFLVLVAIVIAAYFRTWKMALAAIIALLHDLLITVGIYALLGFEVTPASVIGFLTILGYSLYDTVVVFDKVRENTAHITAQTKQTYSGAANLALNQTLVRSINTSVVALLPIGSILFIGALLLGAGTLKDLSLALFVGVAAGTYSSVFIATPLLADLREREPEMQALAKRVRSRAGGATGGARPTSSGSTAVGSTAGGGTSAAGTALLERDDQPQDDAPPRSTTARRPAGPRNQPRCGTPRDKRRR